MDYEELNVYTSSMEELQSLQYEFSSMVSFTCNPRMRQLLAKIASKVHREKNQDLRRILLTEIASMGPIVKGLLTLCQESSEPTVLNHVISILREGVAAKSTWRPQVLAILYQNNATEVVGKMVVRMFKNTEKQKNVLSNHAIVCAFWVLSALAAKDINFSLKIRACGSMKTFVAILKHLASGQLNQLYSILQCMKALSRNNVTATILGREGLLTVMTEIITKLSAVAFGPKLKVASEVLAALTKSKQNQIMFLKQKFLGELLDILCRHQSDSEHGRVAAKIAGSILETFLHLVPSKAGLQQFIEYGGIGVLRNFCLKMDSTDKCWDRLLCRACTVLSQCSVSKPLPLEQESGPLLFTLPKDCQNIIVDESPSDSTSRETTPESDDENDENEENEENDDDENEEENFVQCSQDLDDENLSGRELHPVEQRTRQDIEKQYKKFFAEFHSTNNTLASESKTEFSSKCDNIKSYLDFAKRVRGLCKFVKCAYPDLIGAGSPIPEASETLLEKNRRNYRAKLIQNMKTLLNERSDEEWTVVYDLDQLMIEDKLMEQNENGNIVDVRLGNDDESKLREFSLQANNSLNHSKNRKQLHFESRFESGNLRKAIRIRDREYNLILSPDVNSRQQHQWFYFQVSNMVGGMHSPYTFNIINYEKANSQFNFGMQPVMFSVKESISGRPYWRRIGEDVCYFRNHFSKSSHVDAQNYMTVTFSVTFPHDGDICYLAYHYPYTYSRLMRHLDALKEDSKEENVEENLYFRIDHLTESLNGHPLPMVTITAPIDGTCSNNNQMFPPLCERRIVVLTARVHPGETNASWMMEGLLDHLTSQTFEAKELRANYVFKIVPMLNAEGTINGSHRCGLTGEDLNRRWRDPNGLIHPEIFHTKGLLSYVKQVLEKEIFLFCDFHGHSRKKNVFLYGCSSDQSWWTPDHDFEDDPTTYRELADVFSSLDHCVDKKSCRYLIERARESTARVVVWREFDVSRSYTLEASFCGCNKGQYTGQQISTNMLLDVGKNFSRSLLYLDPNPSDPSEDDDDFPSTPFECRASVEKDESMKITRLVISMPQA